MKTLAATIFGALVLSAQTAGPSQSWWQAWVDDDSYLTNRRNEFWFRDPYGRILPRQGYVAGGVFTSPGGYHGPRRLRRSTPVRNLDRR